MALSIRIIAGVLFAGLVFPLFSPPALSQSPVTASEDVREVRSKPQARITTPQEHLGFNFGDDYHLANYQQISAYWHKLARESNRIVVQAIGKTAEVANTNSSHLLQPTGRKRPAAE